MNFDWKILPNHFSDETNICSVASLANGDVENEGGNANWSSGPSGHAKPGLGRAAFALPVEKPSNTNRSRRRGNQK